MTNLFRSLLLFTALILPLSVTAQDWDYESYPTIPVDILHLDAELKINEIGEFEGDLLYSISTKHQFVDSLVFDAPNIELIRVVINDDNAEYYLDSGKLIISIADFEFDEGQNFTLRLQYIANPVFGVHTNENGTLFTSLLPKSTAHWLPVIDHPRVSFKSDFVITHPASKSVVMNGRRGGTEVSSVENEVTTYSSGVEISPVGLSLVMGTIQRIESTSNSEFTSTLESDVQSLFQRRSDSHINLYSDFELSEGSELLKIAANAFHEVSRFLRKPYPYQDLQIVVLEDEFWESKSYGDGVLYLFSNKGNFQQQIELGIVSQWVGAHIKEEQWSDSDAINLLRAYTHHRLFGYEFSLESSPEPYGVFSDNQISEWIQFIENNQENRLHSDLDRVLENLYSDNHKVLTWSNLNNNIYKNSGHNFRDRFSLEPVVIEEEKHYEYLASMNWDESDRKVEIEFQSLGESIDELVNVVVTEITFLDTKTHELTFTGETDAVVISVGANIENIKLSSDRDNLIITERKPFEFWFYQLRNDESIEKRIKSAKALSEFTDNPDLQLAFRDLLSNEDNEEVQSEILRSLGAITMGATGTEQLFLDRVGENNPKTIRLAALESLAYYNNRDAVVSRLRSTIQRTNDKDIRTTAIRSLYEVTEARSFRNITEDLIIRESVINEVPLLLNLLVDHGEAEAAVSFSETFLAEGFPYHVRSRVLDIILENDESASGWENRITDLLRDSDPRVRYKSVTGLSNLDRTLRSEIKENILAEEFDERVRRALLALD